MRLESRMAYAATDNKKKLMKKIKVLIFHPYLAPYRIDTFNELSNFFDLKVIFQFKNLPEQEFDQEKLKSLLKCKYDYMLTGFNMGTRQFRLGVGKLITEFNPDTVVCHEYGSTSLLCAIYRKIGLFGRWGLTGWTSDNDQIFKCCHRLRKICRQFVLNNLDSLVVYTDSVKYLYSKYIFLDNIGVCPNIQDESKMFSNFSFVKNIAAQYSSIYSLQGKKIALYTGRLSSEKGIEKIICSFSTVVKREPRSMLIIVGDGPEKATLEELSKKLGLKEHVLFTGRFEREYLFAWYLVANIFILASYHEPYGAVVNEALITGLRVLCSKFAGASDLIRNKSIGVVFNPYDMNHLSMLITKEFAQCIPFSIKAIAFKESLMPIFFKDSISEFVRVIHYANNIRKAHY